VSKLPWRVKLVAERQPGVTTETELACIERDAQAGLADLGALLHGPGMRAQLPQPRL
jgi:hypothetical protein